MTHRSESAALEVRGRVATLTLGGRPGNRIHPGLIDDLGRILDRLEDAPDAEVLVVRGAGGVFTEGIDFTDFAGGNPDVHGFHRWEKVVTRVERLPMATVAAVDGPAMGGGFQLVLACDLRVGTARSTFALPEVRQGFLPGMATFRLAKWVGLGVARRWVLTGEILHAAELAERGVLDRVVPEGALDEAVDWAVAALVPVHRVALQLARRLLDESFAVSLEDGVGHLLACQARAIAQEPFLRTLRKAKGTP